MKKPSMLHINIGIEYILSKTDEELSKCINMKDENGVDITDGNEIRRYIQQKVDTENWSFLPSSSQCTTFTYQKGCRCRYLDTHKLTLEHQSRSYNHKPEDKENT